MGASVSMTHWLMEAPDALAFRQRLMIWSTAAFVAITRLYAMSKSMWEWDEALFALALRNYDVVNHRPHPPGFPLFIGLAKLVNLVVPSEFHALQVVTVCGAIALFPLLFFLARELRFAFSTALLGALLFAFFPNVWFFGGTAFSDVPALALACAAALMFLRGARDNRSFLIAAVLLGMALSIRPQNMLLVFAPALLSTLVVLRRSWKLVVAAIAAGVAVVAISYGCAAFASQSPQSFVQMVRIQQKYVHDTDSMFNPGRPRLRDLLPDFITQPMRAGDRATALAILAAVGIVAIIAGVNRAGGLTFLVMFVPMAIFSLCMLDFAAVTRYTVSYVAGHALLAAHGAWWLSRLARRFAPAIQTILIAGLSVAYATWALPGIREVRRHPSPPAAVMEEAMRSIPTDVPLYVYSALGPFATYYIEEAGRKVTFFDTSAQMPHDQPDAWIVVDRFIAAGDGKVFTREDGRTYQFARRRYYVSSVVPIGAMTRFGKGWYDDETYGLRTIRWMAHSAELELPAGTSKMSLTLDVAFPTPLVARRPSVTVSLNGRTIDKFVCTSQYALRELVVDAYRDRPNTLVITTDKTVNPQHEGIGSDPRDLGLQLRSYVWRPVG